MWWGSHEIFLESRTAGKEERSGLVSLYNVSRSKRDREGIKSRRKIRPGAEYAKKGF